MAEAARIHRAELPQIAWAPFPGPQTAFMQCPVEDIFFGGARGPGKTDCLLAKWLLHANRYRRNAKGIVLRESFPNLDEIIERASRLFPKFGGLYNVQSKTWRFKNGARLKLRYLESDADADEYQGHEYSFIGVDEIGGFASLKGLDKVRACLRSTIQGLICQFVSTGNPGGAGHNLVRARYVDQAPPMTPFLACASCDLAYQNAKPICDCHPAAFIQRVFIPARLKDNPALMNNAQYRRQLIAAANGDEALLAAWLEGDWNIAAGGMFNDLWRIARPVIKPFKIPSNWYVDRAFDWGDSSPYAAIYFAESNGEEVEIAPNVRRSFPRGTIFVVGEEYGCGVKPNEGLRHSNTEQAQRVKAREDWLREKGILSGQVHPGPADTQIFAVDNNGGCIANDHKKIGVTWTPANKGQGSRVNGWSRLRELLTSNTDLLEDGRRVPRTKPMEKPGFFVFDECKHTLRTVPDLPRDAKKRDDVDTSAEDHIGDAIRYRLLATKASIEQRDIW